MSVIMCHVSLCVFVRGEGRRRVAARRGGLGRVQARGRAARWRRAARGGSTALRTMDMIEMSLICMENNMHRTRGITLYVYFSFIYCTVTYCTGYSIKLSIVKILQVSITSY